MNEFCRIYWCAKLTDYIVNAIRRIDAWTQIEWIMTKTLMHWKMQSEVNLQDHIFGNRVIFHILTKELWKEDVHNMSKSDINVRILNMLLLFVFYIVSIRNVFISKKWSRKFKHGARIIRKQKFRIFWKDCLSKITDQI